MWCLRMSQLGRNYTDLYFYVYFNIQGLHERLRYRSSDITMVIAVVPLNTFRFRDRSYFASVLPEAEVVQNKLICYK